MLTTFQSEYLNKFFDYDENQPLRAFAREYHLRTEVFDQAHCHLRNKHGVAIPVDEQIALCNRNALSIRAEIIQRERLDCIAFDKAIRDDAGSFDREWRAGLYDCLKHQPNHA